MTSGRQAVQKNQPNLFDDPREIVTARDLTKEQKIKLLSEWEYDLRLQMVATEENMAAEKAMGDKDIGEKAAGKHARPGGTAALYAKVHGCLKDLGVEASEESGATKAGAPSVAS